MSNMLQPVVAELKANIEEFKAKMHEAKGEMSSVEKEGGGHFSKLGVAMAAGLAVGVAAVTEFAAKSVEKFEETAGAVAKMQRLTGESAETMSRLKFAGEEVGISSDKLTGGIVKLEKSIASNNKAFEANGIATKDASGNNLAMSEVLNNVADKFASMPDGVDKTALAIKLFGKTGADLIPLLNKGSDGIKDFGKEADKFGITIGQKNVDDYKKNLKAHREMHAAWEGLQIQLGAKLMPIIAKVSAFFAENLPKAIAFVRVAIEKLQPVFVLLQRGLEYLFTNVLPKVIDGLKQSFGWLMDHKEILIGVAIGVGAALVGLFASWAAGAATAAAASLAAAAPFIAIGVAVAGVAAGVLYAYNHFQTFHDIVDAVGRAIQTATDWLMAHKEVLIAVGAALALVIAPVPAIIAALVYAWTHFETFRDVVKDAIGVVKTIISTGVDFIVGVWHVFGDSILKYITDAWDMIKGVFKGAFETFQGLFDFFRDLFTGKWSKLWGDVEQILSGVWDTIKAIAKGALNGLLDILQGIWDGIKAAIPLAWAGIKAMFKLELEAIKAVFQLVWDGIQAIPGLAWDGIKTAASLAWDAFKAAIQLAWDGIKTAASAAWNAIQKVITDPMGVASDAVMAVWNGIKTFVQTVIDWISGKIDAVVSKVNGAVSALNALNPFSNGVSGTYKPPTPKSSGSGASGTNWASDTMLVGEHGPELITGVGGATVHTASRTAGLLGRAGNTVINHITINSGADPNEIITIIKRFQKSGGVLQSVGATV